MLRCLYKLLKYENLSGSEKKIVFLSKQVLIEFYLTGQMRLIIRVSDHDITITLLVLCLPADVICKQYYQAVLHLVI